MGKYVRSIYESRRVFDMVVKKVVNDPRLLLLEIAYHEVYPLSIKN